MARTQLDSTWPSNIRVERQFEASQLWDVRVPVPQAQAIVDLAVKAGANQVEEVDWQVKDTASLEAKANSAALAKARALAAQLASGLEAKMGELLYVSNTERKPKGLIFPKTSTTKLAMPEPQLKLFPKKS